MVEHVNNDQLEDNFTLANWDEELKERNFVDGYIDAVARYDMDAIDERNLEGIINEIENAIILLSNSNFNEADRWFADLGEKYRIINIAYLIVGYLGDNNEDLYLDNIFQGSMYLLTESKNIESVKAGLVMLAMFQFDYQIKNIIRLFAQADEFTYFAVRTMDEWENSNLDIFDTAKRTTGWGRVYAMEMLVPTNIYIRNWMVENALNVKVPKEQLPADYFEFLEKIKGTSVTDKYLYCSVKPYGMDEEYSYIFPGQLIALGDNVVIPFGEENELIVGKVMSHKICSKEETPYPVESTKVILRILENNEIIDEFPEIAKAEGLKREYEENDQHNHDHCGCGCGCGEHHEHEHENDQEHGHDQQEQAIVTPIKGDTNVIPMFEEEYDDEEDEEEDFIQSEIEELVEYIEDQDLEAILEWAIFHHDDNESPRIMEAVVDAYDYCIENDFEVEVAALNLGSIYYSGVAVPRDYVKAAEYYQKAANEGSVQAICNLGYCYYYGRHQAVDYDKAYGCFNMAGLMGSANALYKLGDMYLNGRHVDRNPVIAFKIYERAEEEVEDWEECNADIQLRLGRCYLRGLGVDQDLEYAMEKLCSAYAGLYARRSTDPFVKGVLKTCRDLMDECEEAMAEDFVERI